MFSRDLKPANKREKETTHFILNLNYFAFNLIAPKLLKMGKQYIFLDLCREDVEERKGKNELN